MILKEIAQINAGHAFREKISEITDSNILAVQMKNIKMGQGIQWQGCTKTTLSGRGAGFLQPGDILFTARGDNNYAVLVDEIPINYRAIAAPYFYIVSCRNEAILPAYLVWLLNQRPCQYYFKREAEGSYTKSIRRSVLESTPIVLPSLREQQKIAHLDNLLNQEQAILEKICDNNRTLLDAIAVNLFENKAYKK